MYDTDLIAVQLWSPLCNQLDQAEPELGGRGDPSPRLEHVALVEEEELDRLPEKADAGEPEGGGEDLKNMVVRNNRLTEINLTKSEMDVRRAVNGSRDRSLES